MSSYHGRMRRTLIIGCIIFVVLICVVYAVQSNFLFTKSLYGRYNAFLGRVLGYVDMHIDKEDLKNCINTGVTSEKYAELQAFLNEYVDAFELYYLYIIKFDDSRTIMVNVCSATSARERAAGEKDMPFLETTDAYPQEELNKYIAAWDEEGLTCFEEDSDYGYYYTACYPVRTDSGAVIALICADIDVSSIHAATNNYIIITVILSVLICAVFAAILLIWLNKSVTEPIAQLESSARRFTEMDKTHKDSRFLLFVPPKITVKNEVKSLAEAIEKMTVEMKDYVNGIIAAEEKERSAKQEAAGFQAIAYQDALTSVKSKAAFDDKADELMRSIMEERAEFAIVMFDMNGLKVINDNYGHVNGDNYIIGSTRIICTVYKHSPVYRVGGDEFVAVLTGEDYENREQLLQRARAEFREAYEDASREPWERYSAAIGMARYHGDLEETVESVYREADERMYRNKLKMKKEISKNR